MRNQALPNTTSILISGPLQLPNETKIRGKGRVLEPGSLAQGSQVAVPGAGSPKGALQAPARLVLSSPWAASASAALLGCHTDLLIC